LGAFLSVELNVAKLALRFIDNSDILDTLLEDNIQHDVGFSPILLNMLRKEGIIGIEMNFFFNHVIVFDLVFLWTLGW
jgi:hypothetical protein